MTAGATTVDEYRKNVEKDAALERRFQQILVLREHLRPEFVNRIDEIIVFRRLGPAELRQITDLLLEGTLHHGQQVTVMAAGDHLEFLAAERPRD